MSSAVALLKDEGLSDDDLRVATALIHCRFRGLFSDIAQRATAGGQTMLVVHGIRRSGDTHFIISRWNGRYIIEDEASGNVFDSDRLGVALDMARAEYPQTTAF